MLSLDCMLVSMLGRSRCRRLKEKIIISSTGSLGTRMRQRLYCCGLMEGLEQRVCLVSFWRMGRLRLCRLALEEMISKYDQRKRLGQIHITSSSWTSLWTLVSPGATPSSPTNMSARLSLEDSCSYSWQSTPNSERETST